MAVWPRSRSELRGKEEDGVEKSNRSDFVGFPEMEALSRRSLERIYSAVLVVVVVLSWSFVIYASRIAAHWLLETRTAHLQQG